MDHNLSAQPLTLPRRMQVRSELAYSHVIEGAVPFWDSSKIIYRPLYPELPPTSVLAWKRGQPFGLAVSKFIEHSKCFLGIGQS